MSSSDCKFPTSDHPGTHGVGVGRLWPPLHSSLTQLTMRSCAYIVAVVYWYVDGGSQLTKTRSNNNSSPSSSSSAPFSISLHHHMPPQIHQAELQDHQWRTLAPMLFDKMSRQELTRYRACSPVSTTRCCRHTITHVGEHRKQRKEVSGWLQER